MENNFLEKNRKKVFGGAAVLAGVLFLVWVLVKPQKLPAEFLEARRAASLASQEIVDLTDATSQKIKEVDLSNPNLENTLRVIKEARDSNNEAYDKAFGLSRHLQKMAELFGKIRAKESRELAYQAVSLELGLISELISYTERMNRFLENLAELAKTQSRESLKATNEYLLEVNQKAAVINKLNKEFTEKMKAFDESF